MVLLRNTRANTASLDDTADATFFLLGHGWTWHEWHSAYHTYLCEIGDDIHDTWHLDELLRIEAGVVTNDDE